MTWMRATAIAALGVLAAGWAAAEMPGLTRHVERSEYIRDIMHRLDTLYYERIRTELDARRERRDWAARLDGALAELSGTTDSFAESAVTLRLGESGQERFVALAQRLHTDVGALRDELAREDYESFRAGYDRLDETCRECHALFRDVRPEAVP